MIDRPSNNLVPLLPYEEYSVSKEEFAIFPEAAEERVIRHEDHFAVANLLYPEHKAVAEAFAGGSAYKTGQVVVLLKCAHIPAVVFEIRKQLVILFEGVIVFRVTECQGCVLSR